MRCLAAPRGAFGLPLGMPIPIYIPVWGAGPAPLEWERCVAAAASEVPALMCMIGTHGYS